MSASQLDNLINQVNQYNICDYVTEVLGILNIYAKSKLGIAQKWINDNNINPSNVLLVGDSMHDYEIAQTLKCKCVLYSNGHQNVETLSKSDALIIDDLNQVVDYIKRINQ